MRGAYFLITAAAVLTTILYLDIERPNAAHGTFVLPFDPGVTMYVCQGYQTGWNPPYSTHPGYELDLSTTKPSGSRCTVDNASAGKNVRAPFAGQIVDYEPSRGELCIKSGDGFAVRLTHINASKTSGSVSKGQIVGKIAGQNDPVGNNGVAHLHIQLWESESCFSGTERPFSGAASLSGYDLYNKSGTNDWQGTALKISTPTPSPTPKKCVGKGVRLDFSCDGVADLAAIYDYGGGLTKAWFFYNNGPGTLTPHVAWTSNQGSWTWSKTKLVAGDFSGDGVDELAAMYDYGGGLTKAWFFYNNGPGTLTPHLAWSSNQGSWTWSKTKLVAGDFSGDGTDDLAAMYDYGNGLTKIWFFYNNGPGTLTPYLAWTSSPGGWSWANTKLVAGDFNSDGVDDLAAMYDYGDDNMKIWFFYTDKKTRTASHHLAYTSCDGCWSWEKTKLVAGDFSGDGTDDLAAMYDYGGDNMKIWFFYNNGPGTLSHHKAYTSCSGCWSWEKTKLVAGDFSGDGVDELAAMYDYGGDNMKIWFFYNNGPGTLSHHKAYTSCSGCWSWSDTMLAGEASADPPPPPASTPTPTPSATTTPTATLTPIASPTPTGTVAGATLTPTPALTLAPGVSPSPTPTPTPLPTAVPEPTKADGDCDGDVDAVDVVKVLQYAGRLPYSQNLGCPTFGSWLVAVAELGGAGFVFGDMDCDFDVDAVDALWILRYVAALPVNLPQGCDALSE